MTKLWSKFCLNFDQHLVQFWTNFCQRFYTKSNSEICLLGIKGKVKPITNYISSVIIEPKEKHSKKPDLIRNKIVDLCGDLPRIELFARQKIDGWDHWGNEV